MQTPETKFKVSYRQYLSRVKINSMHYTTNSKNSLAKLFARRLREVLSEHMIVDLHGDDLTQWCIYSSSFLIPEQTKIPDVFPTV